MKLALKQQIHGFTLVSKEPLSEINGVAYTMIHEKSGTRLLFLENEDNNKSFSIGFKTAPANDTGVFHILEHSVLCGSDKFPVKEPFVNLLKSSMQTFLNAMTFGDKTLYPVASTNDQDLENLADVYMDAVLHPAIYHKKEIFEQEGWHLEVITDASGDKQLTYNGVVYNEMKGALSDPASVLYDKLQSALFPDTPYAFESGGTPKAIPSLTYEQFLEEHRRNYRLDNSYITLYGNVDVDRMLGFLDEKYLGPESALQKERDAQALAEGKEVLLPQPIPVQEPVCVRGLKHEMQTAPENSCMGLAYVIGDVHERTKIIASDILLDAIMGSNEAPLKRALLDADIAGDAQSFVADAVQQPFIVLQLRSLKEGASEQFKAIIDTCVKELASGQLDHNLIEASLSRAEFVMREAEYGIADGVALSMAALCGWLYDDEMPTTYLKYEDDFAFLRSQLEDDYFENLLKELFLDNKHFAEVEIVPVESTSVASEDSDNLCTDGMTEADFAQIEREVERLRKHQEAPDSEEDLATLPRLGVADIGDAPSEPAYSMLSLDDGTPCLYHECPSHGITYVYRYFTLDYINFEELPYIAILGMVLGKLATEAHSSSEIDTLINGRLGNLSFFSEFYEDESNPDALRPMFIAGASALSENIQFLAELPAEIMTSTCFDDSDKIKAVLMQKKIGMEQHFANAGHASAMARLASYYLPAGVVREQIGGVDFYLFICDLLKHFDEKSAELSRTLKDLSCRLFARKNMTISFTGSQADFETYQSICKHLPTPEPRNEGKLSIPAPNIKNEAFIVPTDVCYAACGFDRRSTGYAYSGTWQVASRAISFDYLWNEVRVKGGAYGAGFQAARTGTVRFYSYRDPHFTQTIERFNSTPQWIESYKPKSDELEGYIVATVSAFDSPLKTRALVRRQDGDYFGNRTPDSRKQTRNEMIASSIDDIHQLAQPLHEILSNHALCVFGNEEILRNEAAEEGLTIIDLLNS